ncbi:MAG: long-chain fatty acid--CoA ligase [Firmicutes bacterium]|nr:long-chain fatty acid--CoA ligase [Bacillota bacterium]
MSYTPLPQRFLEAVDRFGNPREQLYKVGGVWQATSAQQMLHQVAALAHALAELGIGPGDRVGLFAPNRPEWHIVDFAVLGLGAVDVPIYFNEAPDRIVYILNDSGAKVAVAIGEEQVRRLLSVRERLASVEHVLVGGVPAEFDGRVLRYEALVAQSSEPQVAEYRRRAAQVRPEQLASLLYTSGTTGEPKGVMLTHDNFSSNATDVLHGMKLRARNDVGLSFLPLSHVYERLIDYTYLFNGVTVAYVDRIEALPAALLEVRPTLMAAVPRIFEKIYAGIQERAAQTTGVRRKLFDWAMKVARQAAPWRGYGRPVSLWVKLQWWLANWFVYPKIRAALGGRIRRMNSGAAPIARELLEFFWAVGVKIYQGYGLTETSPVISTNHELSNRLGSVGRPIPNVEVRIAEDGEILVRGPCVMQGYYNKPEQTREAFTEDGWLKTGDIGWMDADGYLYVTDRKKDLIKTAAGKFVAPQPIENRLKTSPYIANAAVVGDRHKFVVALLVPNFAALEARAREHGLTFHSRAELAAHPWVRQLLELELERLTADLAQYERPKRFAVLDHDFSFDGGQLTYTMKLKRRVIEQRYAEQIAALYADVEQAHSA